ncbi:MAG: hypothetical protein QOE70_6142 [Chthoniobacter sp.]|jgi:hypothetical protein|nr:hypothetical protein [Chthoniobacter sp.]
MSTKASAANLAQALKDLNVEWQYTKTYWNDVKSREFESQYLDPLPNHVARAMAVMEEVDALLRKVRNDCE